MKRLCCIVYFLASFSFLIGQNTLLEELKKLRNIELDSVNVAKGIDLLDKIKDQDPRGAIDVGKVLLEKIERANNDWSKIEFRNTLATVYFKANDYEIAERLLLGSSYLAKRKGYKLMEVKTLVMIGNLYRITGRYNEALLYLDEAQFKGYKIDAYDYCAKIFSHKGFIYWQKGQNLIALVNFQRSADLNDSLHKEKPYASAIMGMALIYDDLKETSKAWDYYRKALSIYKKHEDNSNVSTTLLNLSEMLYEQSSPDSALHYINECIDVAEKYKFENTAAQAHVARGRILLKKGKVKESEKDFFTALKIAKETDDMSSEATAWLGLYDFYSSVNQSKKMEASLLEAIGLYKKTSDSIRLKECYLIASNMWKGHNYEKAYNYRILYDSLNMRAFNFQNWKAINELLVKYDSKIKQQENERLVKENLMSQALIRQQKNQKYLVIIMSLLVLLLIFVIMRGLRLQRDNFQLKVKDQQVELVKLSEMKAEAELKALQARINPHFLYNSLNSIAALIATAPAKAEVMTVNLSKLFRYTINLRESNWSAVNEELNIVQIYLDVEKVRFGDRISFYVICDDPVKHYYIPRFIIQPLVENSLKHGLKNISKDGVLKVNILETNRHLKIIVADNGTPFPEDMMGGYGLQSITDKLNLLCSENWKMNFSNEPEKRIEITLPKKVNI